jgi:hypothetical protein
MTTFVRHHQEEASACRPGERTSPALRRRRGHRGRALARLESDLPYEATDRGDCPTVRARSEPAKGLLRSLPRLLPLVRAGNEVIDGET